jgi:hypothetical protein
MAKHKHKFLGNHAFEILYVLLFLVLLFIAFAPGIMKVMNTQTYVVHVTDKDRVSDKNKYLVYSFDLQGESRVFEITDSLLKFRFDSSDDYNQIEVGKTYKFTTGGYRVPIFSWYPNIYEYEEVPAIEDKSAE